MILLKYAKLLPIDATENIWNKIKMSDELVQVLKFRIKEFVVCGHTIDAKDACMLSEEERAFLYIAKVEWEKEKASLPSFFMTNDVSKEKDWLEKASPKMPVIEDDLTEEYLRQSVVHYGGF